MIPILERGMRFYDILTDEHAQIPKDIMDVVVLGMGATSQDPVKNAKLMRYINRLKEEGKESEHLLKNLTTNKLIMVSTAFYQFNHLWDTVQNYYKLIKRKDKKEKWWKYGLMMVPFNMVPEGFMESEFIEMCKKEMSSIEFDMEFKCRFPSDSDGFFKASTVSNAFISQYMFNMDIKGEYDAFVKGAPKMKGDPEKRYILSIDPARTSDDCAFCVIEENYFKNTNLIVHLSYINNRRFKEAAERIWEICRTFNISDIYMDMDGGGVTIKDYLSDVDHIKMMYNADGKTRQLIWDKNDPMSYFDGEEFPDRKIEKLHQPKNGRHILKMVKFGATWLSEANHCLLNGLEHGNLMLPRKLGPDDLKSIPSLESKGLNKIEAAVLKLQIQLQSIVVTKTAKGFAHWDTLQKKDKKDLYSALLVGYYELNLKLTGKEKDVEHTTHATGGWSADLANDPSVDLDGSGGLGVASHSSVNDDKVMKYFDIPGTEQETGIDDIEEFADLWN